MRTIRNSFGSLVIIGGLIGSLNFIQAAGVPMAGDGGDGGTNGSFTSNYTLPEYGTNLWLEVPVVSDGLVSLILHNTTGTTGTVYEVWSKPALTDPAWNIEQGVEAATNQDWTPTTIPVLDRTNLFIWARDWTGIDENSNGIPDSWEWKYFGTLTLSSNADYDSDGTNILDEYQNGTDPNKIRFLLWFTNQYVNTNIACGTITVLGGVPANKAVTVNNTNFAAANWQPYSSNVVASLNAGDGAYEVWAGLKGLPPGGCQTWHGFHLILDTVPPIITIANPAVGVVSQPMIQVQGYANEALSRLTFDVSNAVGIQTNLTGYITRRYYDLNRLEFTTNWFQCYDIALTNGLNTVTLHATDLAGNVTTTSVSFTLDYSGDTTPPALTVIWPQDGTAIGGSSFTLQAQVDDNTATVTAQIVDANGDTNTVQGLVERSGRVWAQDLPLGDGENTLAVTATDAAGNTSVTNLTLVQSAVTVTMNPLNSDQQNQWPVTVTGTVSDPSCAVTVNGVQATVNSDGTWEADGVLASRTGVASFDVEVYAGGAFNLAASRKSNSLVDANNANMGGISPAFLVSSFKKSHSLVKASDAGTDNSIASQMLNQLLSATVVASDYSGVGYYDWTTNVNVLGQSNLVQNETLAWDYLLGGTWNFSESFYWVITTNFYGGGGSADVPSYEDGINSWLFSPTFEYATLVDTNYQRIVQTKVMIAPQGMVALATTQTLQTTQSYLVRACAASFSQRIKPGIDTDFVTRDFFFNFITGGIWSQQWYAGDVPLPPEWFQINGQTLINTGQVNDDGSVWGATVVQAPDGAPVDVTPSLNPYVTLTQNDYTFLMKVSKLYPPAVDANRDGEITFNTAGQANPDYTTATNAYRFWVNNDYDWYDSSINDYADLEPSPGTTADNLNTIISCTRDLEDYTRLWINTRGITTELQNGTFQLALEWKEISTGEPQIRIFSAVETNGGSLYLTNESTAQQQTNAPYGNCILDSSVSQDNVSQFRSFFFPASFWANSVSTNQPVAHLLFDAVSRGSGTLVISIYNRDGTKKLAEGPPLYLKLQDVKEMYERYSVGESGTPATTASVVATPYSYDTSIPSENNYILFVHGWNLAPWERDAFAETAFKRLYWQGYKGRFGAFQWPTDYGFSGIISVITDAHNYDNSESNAWASATGLLSKLTDLNAQYPGHVYMFAHSMGNVIVGEALKQSGSSQVVNTYIAMQGALPAHCYDPTTQNRAAVNLPDFYASYWTSGAPSYFNGTVGAGSYINFYNQQDWALGYWGTDQNLKPDTGYGYDFVAQQFHRGTFFTTPLNFPTNTYEIFAYCDPAPSFALGAQANVGGAFLASGGYNQLDLDTTYSFGSLHKGHSAEFNSDNMNRWSFWDTCLRRMQLK